MIETTSLWLLRLPGLHIGDVRRLRTNVRVMAVTVGWIAALSLLGVTWAAIFGFFDLVLTTLHLLLPLATLTAAMTFQVYWGAATFPTELVAGAACFRDSQRIESLAARFVSNVTRRWWLTFVFLLGAVALILVAKSVLGLEEAVLTSSIPRGWSDPVTFPKVALAIVWALPAVALAAVGIHGLLALQLIIQRTAAEEVVDVPVFVLPRIRRIVMFSQVGALVFSVDVFLYYVATFGRPGLFSFAFIAASALIGVLTLMHPHLAYHMTLRRMQERLSAEIRRAAEDALRSVETSAPERVRVMTQISSDPPVTWPYDPRVVASLTLAPLVSFAVGFLGLITRGAR